MADPSREAQQRKMLLDLAQDSLETVLCYLDLVQTFRCAGVSRTLRDTVLAVLSRVRECSDALPAASVHAIVRRCSRMRSAPRFDTDVAVDGLVKLMRRFGSLDVVATRSEFPAVVDQVDWAGCTNLTLRFSTASEGALSPRTLMRTLERVPVLHLHSLSIHCESSVILMDEALLHLRARLWTATNCTLMGDLHVIDLLLHVPHVEERLELHNTLDFVHGGSASLGVGVVIRFLSSLRLQELKLTNVLPQTDCWVWLEVVLAVPTSSVGPMRWTVDTLHPDVVQTLLDRDDTTTVQCEALLSSAARCLELSETYAGRLDIGAVY